MTSTASITPINSYKWTSNEHRLSSGDSILILTDTFGYWEKMYPCSVEQEWFRVGAVNLTNNEVGFWRFSIDDAAAMLKAGRSSPPWTDAFGILVKRDIHLSGKSTGRYAVTVTNVDVSDTLLAEVGHLREMFRRKGHEPNSSLGMWSELERKANTAIAIEKVALRMTGVFKAVDVRKAVGDDVNVGPTLHRLVRNKRLTLNGKKYQVAPPIIIERVDWTG